MIEIAIGFFSGIISGMGVGGGMILIPSMVFFLNYPQYAAQGVNLYCFLPTAATALFVHAKNKNVEFKKAVWILLSGIPMSLLGAAVAGSVDQGFLAKLFGIFLTVFGVKEVYDGLQTKN